MTTLNDRNIEPGTIDTNYVPQEDRRLDEFNPDGRNISPGKGESGQRKDHVQHRRDRASAAATQPGSSVFDMDVIQIIRLTRQQVCPVRGCTYQNGKGPFEYKDRKGLNTHVRAKHPDVNSVYVMRTIDILMKEK